MEEYKCEKVVRIIQKARCHIKDNQSLCVLLDNLECNNVKDDEKGTFHFSEFDSADASENKIISALLGKPEKNQKLYRYVPLRTLYEILNNGTIRMSGIAGMNDKTEQSFTDNYIYGKAVNDCALKSKSNIIKYITSCSKLNDNLNMWRLYADDAKGACLVFSQGKPHKYYMLQNVMYSDLDGQNKGLNFLKGIVEDVKKIRENFTFCSMSHWKHFFKPFEFSSEEEVRLILFDDKKGVLTKLNRDWVLTYDNSIFNQVIDIPIESFPLKLEEIVLGCKCPQKDTNIEQIKLLLQEKNLSNVKVSPSKIDCYR